MNIIQESEKLNVLICMPQPALRAELLRCCGSPGWVNEMIAQLSTVSSVNMLKELATTIWWNLPTSEWKIAFTAHPQIGDAAALKSKFAHSKWEGDEQKGANAASDETLQQLAKLNAEYLEKNGFIFLICATGKTADEMVAALEERMTNDSKTELQIAAGEQDKITKLRLVKLLDSMETTPQDLIGSAPISRL